MALPLQPAWRETTKRRLPSIHGGSAPEDVGVPCSSPPKIKARRLEGVSGGLLWPSKQAAAATTAAAAGALSRTGHLRGRSPLASPLKRRLQTSVDDDSRAAPTGAVRAAGDAASAAAPAVDLTANSKMLQSPVRLHFPLTSSGAPRVAPELPVFPSAASGCVAAAPSGGSTSLPAATPQMRGSQQAGMPNPQAPSQAKGGTVGALSLDARSFLTTAAAAAAAASAAPGSPQGAESAACRRQQQRPSFLDDPASPFSTSRRRRPPPAAAAAAAASEAVAAAAATPSPTRRAPTASGRGDLAKGADEFMDQKVSPVSSRRRASPYHNNSTSSSRGEASLEGEAVSPFRLTPPRKKPQFSFDAVRSDTQPQSLQQQQQEQQEQQQQAAACCELSLTPQEILSMQQLFSEQQQRNETFCCSSLDTCAAEEAPVAAVRLNRQLERLCRLYGLLRILFDRLHDRGEPLLLFSSILPAYTKLALTHHARSASEPPVCPESSTNSINGDSSNSSSNSSTGETGGVISGSSKIRNDLIKDVGRLVWLLPQLLQWKARRMGNATQNAAATASTSASLSPMRKQQQQYDIQIVELKNGVPLACRASDGEQRQQQLRRRLISYTLQWQNFCLQLQQQQQQKHNQVPLLRLSRQLMIQHGSWLPGFKLETVPSPPAAAPPELQRPQQQELLPQQPPSAFKGDSLIGHIGGSPIRCVRQQQQQQRYGAEPQQAQQQRQGQQLETKGNSGSSTPAAAAGGSVGGVSSVSTCTSEPAASPADPSLGPSPSPALLLSPLCRARQPTRQFSLLSSPVGSRSPSPPLERRSTSNSTSPTRSPVSERLRRKTEERMAARLQREAAQQIRRDLYEKVQQTKNAQTVLHCLLDACVYHDRRSRIDVRVLTDLFVSKLRTPLSLATVERAVVHLEGLCPDSIQFRANVICLHPSTDPSALRKLLDSKLKEAEEAALAADRNEPPALLC